MGTESNIGIVATALCASVTLFAGTPSAATAATVTVQPSAAALVDPPPPTPTIVHPLDTGSLATDARTVLAWTPIDGATSYYVKLVDRSTRRRERLFSSSRIDPAVCDAALCTLQADARLPLSEGGHYVWRVGALVGDRTSGLAHAEFHVASDGARLTGADAPVAPVAVPVPDEPTFEEPAPEGPAPEEPAPEEPAPEEPAPEEPAPEEPAPEEPAQEEPAQEEPASEEPARDGGAFPAADADGSGAPPVGRALDARAVAWFVDPRAGDDGRIGTREAPLRTLSRALEVVSPGETIVLRGGVHEVRALALRASGSDGAPITITSADGESAVIDSSVAALRDAPGDAWELVDAETATYRSRDSGYGGEIYTARVRDARGQSIMLVPYHDAPGRGARGLADLQSNVQTVADGARYVGPGIYNDGGRLWIRLQPVERSAVHGEALPQLASTDPNALDVRASDAFGAIDLHGSHVRLTDLTVRGALHGIVVHDGSTGTSLERVRFETHSAGMLLREGARDVSVHDSDFVGQFPRHVAFTDMKGRDGQSQPASHWSLRVAAVNGVGFDGLTVTGSRFHRVFDGFVLRDASDVRIVGNTGWFLDDMVQLGSDSERVEIAHNRIFGAGPSYSGKGDSDEPGTVWIHGNVIDATRPTLWGKADPQGRLRRLYSGWHGPLPFPSHDRDGIVSGVPWKIYHNTVRYDGSYHSVGSNTALWEQINATGETHEVYNNVFINVGDGYFMRGLDPEVVGQRYDGNLYWREPGGDGGFVARAVDGGRTVDVDSLDAWRASAMQRDVEARTGAGWEIGGVEADPLLDEALRPGPGSPALDGAVALPANLPGPVRTWRGALGG